MWVVKLLLSQTEPLSPQVPAGAALCAVHHRGTAQILAFLPSLRQKYACPGHNCNPASIPHTICQPKPPLPCCFVSAAHLTVVMGGVDRSQNMDKNRGISLQKHEKYHSNRSAFPGSDDNWFLSKEVPVCIYARNTENLKKT